MKKFISVLLSVCLLMSSLVMYTSAEGTGSVSQEKETKISETKATDAEEKKAEESSTYVNFASAIDDEAEYADDSIIVSMRPGAKEANHVYTAEDFPELDVDYIEDLTYLTNEELLNDPEFMANYTQILQIHLKSPSKENVVKAVSSMSKRSVSDVADVIPNYAMETESCIDPNDPGYLSEQYKFATRINLPAAWDITTGSQNVKVAVLDSGIVNHPDLVNNLSTGYDLYYENTITSDAYTSHGTVVAGIIGAKGNNSTGTAGVAWNVSLVPVQFEPTGANNTDGNKTNIFIRALTYLNNANIPIANYSHSMGIVPSAVSTFESAINNYFGIFIASAGNKGMFLDENLYEYTNGVEYFNLVALNCNNMLVVMGTNKDDNDSDETKASSSNYSKNYVDIAAPMRGYTTTFTTNPLNYCYVEIGGTSISAPYVAGAAALIKSIRPELSTVDIKNIILSSADEKSSLGSYCVDGRFLNVAGAVEMALAYKTPEPQTFMEDVNNDGYDDLVYFREYTTYRHLQVFLGSNENHLGTPAISPSTSDVTKCSVDTLTTDKYNSTDKALMGDVNGDGRMDMIVCGTNPSNRRKLFVYLGQSDGKFSSAITTGTSDIVDLVNQSYKLFVGKFNNDGYCDFLVHYKDTNGTRTNLVYPGTSTGAFGSGVKSTSTVSYVEEDEVFVVDVGGDGYDDVVVHWIQNGNRQLCVYPCYVNGRFSSPNSVNTYNSHSYDLPCEMRTGDFNGDGYGDFYVWKRNSNGYGSHIIYYGMASGTFNVNNYLTLTTSLSYNYTQQLFVGDVNNDSIDDIIMHWPDPSTKQTKLRVCFGSTTNPLAESATRETTSVHTLDEDEVVYRVHVGDVNGWGDDIITEVASASTAYRSRALINLGTANGFQTYAYDYKLRTYFYIDYES